MRVNAQGVVGYLEALFLGNLDLQRFNFGIMKFFYPPAIEAYQMVVVFALVEFVDGAIALKVAARQNARLLKLREHAINRGQTNVKVLRQKLAVDVFGGEVALLTALKKL